MATPGAGHPAVGSAAGPSEVLAEGLPVADSAEAPPAAGCAAEAVCLPDGACPPVEAAGQEEAAEDAATSFSIQVPSGLPAG